MMSRQSPPDAVVAVAALSRALDAVVTALTEGSPAGLLATEAGLSAALLDVTRVASVASCDRAQLLAELARARMMLERCRLVGAAVAGVIDGCLAARGLSTTYDRSGRHSRP